MLRVRVYRWDDDEESMEIYRGRISPPLYLPGPVHLSLSLTFLSLYSLILAYPWTQKAAPSAARLHRVAVSHC
jgi:hypothetical protein